MIFYAILWACKLRIIIIFINLKLNIRVETCLCTHAVAFGYFVLSGLIQIQKRIQNNLKKLWNIWKGKRKGNSFLFSVFSPAQSAAQPSPAARLPSARVAHLLILLFPRLGPSPTDGPVRARCRLSLCVSLTSRARVSDDAFFFSTPRPISFPVPPTESFPPNPFFPCLEHLRVIKTGCHTSPLHLTPKQRTDVVPRRPRSSRSRSRPPSWAPHRFRIDSVFVSYLGELAMFPTPSRCFSFAR
jgi:hypothetical protein